MNEESVWDEKEKRQMTGETRRMNEWMSEGGREREAVVFPDERFPPFPSLVPLLLPHKICIYDGDDDEQRMEETGPLLFPFLVSLERQ